MWLSSRREARFLYAPEHYVTCVPPSAHLPDCDDPAGNVHWLAHMPIQGNFSRTNEWTGHVMSLGEGLLMNEVGSWMTGVNRNLADKQKPKIMRYSGGHPAYREFCNYVKEDSYRNIIFSFLGFTRFILFLSKIIAS